MSKSAQQVVSRILIGGVVASALAAGTAAAFLYSHRRDVTTASPEALRLYREARENEQRLYFREAISGYANALGQDPNFVMAGVRLSALLRGKDPQRARDLLACVGKCREGITERERLLFEIFEKQSVPAERWSAAEIGTLLDSYLAKFPEDPEGYQQRAQLLGRQGKGDEAVQEWERLLTVDPNYAIAWNNLGYHAMARGDWAGAEERFKRYRFLAPDQANPHDSLGELFIHLGRYDEAAASLDRALAAKPDFVASVAHYGTLESSRGNPDAAAKRFRQAYDMSESAGEKTEWLVGWAMTQADAGRGAEALAELDALTRPLVGATEKESARLVRTHSFLRARLEIAAGRLAEAEERLQVLLKETPPASAEKGKEGKGDPRGAILRALLAQAKGDHAAAAEAWRLTVPEREAVADGTPYYPWPRMARVALARELLALGNRAEAEKVLQPLLALNPRFAAAAAFSREAGIAVGAAAPPPAPGPAS